MAGGRLARKSPGFRLFLPPYNIYAPLCRGGKARDAGSTGKKTGEDGLPIPPYAVYNIGNSSSKNLLDFVVILQQELIRAGVLPADYDFEAPKELVPMQPGDVPVTYADASALERDFGQA